jgi:hypothetical protein
MDRETRFVVFCSCVLGGLGFGMILVALAVSLGVL